MLTIKQFLYAQIVFNKFLSFSDFLWFGNFKKIRKPVYQDSDILQTNNNNFICSHSHFHRRALFYLWLFQTKRKSSRSGESWKIFQRSIWFWEKWGWKLLLGEKAAARSGAKSHLPRVLHSTCAAKFTHCLSGKVLKPLKYLIS